MRSPGIVEVLDGSGLGGGSWGAVAGCGAGATGATGVGVGVDGTGVAGACSVLVRSGAGAGAGAALRRFFPAGFSAGRLAARPNDALPVRAGGTDGGRGAVALLPESVAFATAKNAPNESAVAAMTRAIRHVRVTQRGTVPACAYRA